MYNVHVHVVSLMRACSHTHVLHVIANQKKPEAAPDIKSGLQDHLFVHRPCLLTLPTIYLVCTQQHCLYTHETVMKNDPEDVLELNTLFWNIHVYII